MPINPISSPFINFIDLLQSSLLHAEFVSSLLLRCIVHQYDKNVAGRGALHFISEVLDFWRVPETKACTKSEFHTHTAHHFQQIVGHLTSFGALRKKLKKWKMNNEE